MSEEIVKIDTIDGVVTDADTDVLPSSPMNHLLIAERFDHLQRVAKMFASCSFLPPHYSGNVANCAVAVHMAHTLRCDPVVLMQGTYVVNGKIGFESKFSIALANTRGGFDGAIDYVMKGEGDNLGCTAYAKLRTGRKISSPEVTVRQAKALGWYSKNQNWQHNTELMLKYRAATYLIRLHRPQLLMGLQTIEELQDVQDKSERSSGAKALSKLLEDGDHAQTNGGVV